MGTRYTGRFRETEVVTFRLDVRIVAALNAAADGSEVSRNRLVEELLAERCGLVLVQNGPHEPRRDSGVALDGVVGNRKED